MDIGGKIKKSRTDAKITQEQAAQALGISRQTISNWENERSYPDIVSVLKMSDLYSVSLDYLLKGEGPMKDYLDYALCEKRCLSKRFYKAKFLCQNAFTFLCLPRNALIYLPIGSVISNTAPPSPL